MSKDKPHIKSKYNRAIRPPDDGEAISVHEFHRRRREQEAKDLEELRKLKQDYDEHEQARRSGANQ